LHGVTVPGFAIATLKIAAWLNLLLGVGAAFSISLFNFAPLGPKAPSGDFARIALELLCVFEGFMGWALLLVVAVMAEQLDALHSAMQASKTENDSD
jgi:hypothetical protein